ncbi:PREDICTED: scavenger receptor class F member 1 [Chaetura pelagica]|uniref:scavenger receptor class F member 1 n=1 Tax=Chaetura pelagica TaxID=8897 RepID=UPI0005237178|nr:PREDICTED: scavenger receptor class F member 1 [Chaetura pelagica]
MSEGEQDAHGKKPKAGRRKRPRCGRDGTDGCRCGAEELPGLVLVSRRDEEHPAHPLPPAVAVACCPGWKQEGRECTAALCEGEEACRADEVCVRPGVCLCKPGFFGADCSSRFKDHGTLAAAILVPLLLLLLCIACCCCGAGPADARDRAAVPDDGVLARMKHHVQGVLANLSAMMPCFSLGGYKLPKVTALSTVGCRDLPPRPRPAGTFGDGCQFLCPECVSGTCDPVSGECVCQEGYWGASCNDTCPEGYFGVNCSSPCQCSRGTCHPARGDCVLSFKDHGTLAAAILVPLLLLLLCIACCCCGAGPADARDRAAVPDDGVLARMKHHVQGVLANLSAMMPCFSLGGYKLPKVTVSHHDTELPFTPSFIEPPSAAWVSDSSFSSFDTDNEGPEYSVPPREGDIHLHEGVSPPGEALPDPSAFNSEDVSLPFDIPRTSSIAKAKRPSVSFAEGTKFGAVETPSPSRKPKTPWGPSKLSQPLGDAAAELPPERPKSIRAEEGVRDVVGATERGKSPELVLSLESKGQAASEEEPKYENVTSGSADSLPSPAKEPPAPPAAT